MDTYPLQWPHGWKRSPAHAITQSRYRISSFIRVRNGVLKSVAMLGGIDIVVSSNIPVRVDGLPYANVRQPVDRGVAVYWTDRVAVQTRVIACDCWLTVAENLHAIELAVDALRQIERTGASQILDRAFTGFAALPADAGRDAEWWREPLGLVGVVVGDLMIDEAYRERARRLHPDAPGGSHDTFVALGTARDAAKRAVAAAGGAL